MTPSYVGSGGPEGAFTEELLVRGAKLGESLLAMPDGLPYDIAAMTEPQAVRHRSEEHTSELQSLMRISYAVFCLKKKKIPTITHRTSTRTLPNGLTYTH